MASLKVLYSRVLYSRAWATKYDLHITVTLGCVSTQVHCIQRTKEQYLQLFKLITNGNV